MKQKETEVSPREGWLEVLHGGMDDKGREFMNCDMYFEPVDGLTHVREVVSETAPHSSDSELDEYSHPKELCDMADLDEAANGGDHSTGEYQAFIRGVLAGRKTSDSEKFRLAVEIIDAGISRLNLSVDNSTDVDTSYYELEAAALCLIQQWNESPLNLERDAIGPLDTPKAVEISCRRCGGDGRLWFEGTGYDVCPKCGGETAVPEFPMKDASEWCHELTMPFLRDMISRGEAFTFALQMCEWGFKRGQESVLSGLKKDGAK